MPSYTLQLKVWFRRDLLFWVSVLLGIAHLAFLPSPSAMTAVLSLGEGSILLSC